MNFFEKMFGNKKEGADKEEEHDTTIEENQHEFNEKLNENEIEDQDQNEGENKISENDDEDETRTPEDDERLNDTLEKSDQ